MVCRVTIESTRMADGSDVSTTMCIPVENGTEADHLVPIELPESITWDNEATINEGRLVIQLSNSTVTENNVTVSESTDITILSSEEALSHYDDENEHQRVLGERALAATGRKTIAIVRVSAGGAPNRYTALQLRRFWFGKNNSFKKQVADCSHGALMWSLKGVYDVNLGQSVKSYSTKDSMQTAIETKLKSMVGTDLSKVADKIVFCYPQNSPGSWIASASFNFIRATFNDVWCSSLSAQLHEIGHTIGLLHASKGGDDYGDTSGMMGYSDGGSGAPKKCYNAVHNWQLGWYQGRRESVTGNKIIRLASFVDYDKAASNERVVVQVKGKYYLQYNSVKSFNYQSDLFRNQVTVTGILSNGNSVSLAGLSVGQVFNDGNVKIKVCSSQTGNAGQDVMIVSIGGNCP